jgi:hypothetical protein
MLDETAALSSFDVWINARQIATRGQLDFDDLRAQIGHHARQDWRGDVMPEV